MTDTLTVGQFPARIMLPNERAADLSNLPVEAGAFVWSTEISSNRLDSYFTHMAESTLKNFAADTKAGVTFLDSHNHRNLGYGQSLTGAFMAENGINRVLADFYTVPGIRFGSGLSYESTDDFIRAVKARLVRDVSVGFYGGDMLCDICGNSFYDFRECPHWPGVEYPVGEQGALTKIATFEIIDAHLAEVSAVYDGATPEAMILKARQQAEAGEMEPNVARILEVNYRIKLPGASRSFQVTKPEGAKTMEKETSGENANENEVYASLVSIRAIAVEAGCAEDMNSVEAVRWMAGELARLQPLADDGAAYRAALIEEAIVEGVRANGKDFPAETYRGMLEKADLPHIKQVRDQFAAAAIRNLPGGRHTVDDPQPPAPVKKSVSTVPDAAYAA